MFANEPPPCDPPFVALTPVMAPPVAPPSRSWAVAETLLVFAVFFLHGASSVPDVNEPHYLTKAKHYWNPDWCRGDFFLESPDAHHVFYWTFGWLTLVAPLPVVAWIGRLLTWALLAWSWRRLSWAVAPRRLVAVLTAGLLVALNFRLHLAGEWIVGGVEAKGFSFALVFLALEALVCDRWNRAWLLLGAATAMHALVGGWSAVATGMAWLLTRSRPPLRSLWPGLLGAAVMAALGVQPAVKLSLGVDPDIVAEANSIYVFDRLYHHLVPQTFPAVFVTRFIALVGGWLALVWMTKGDARQRRLQAFVAGGVGISAVGAAISFATVNEPFLAAALLRYYWFRQSDMAVPMGVALAAGWCIAGFASRRSAVRGLLLVASLSFAGWHLGDTIVGRIRSPQPPADPPRKVLDYDDWRRACAWIALEKDIPPDARFLTPRRCQTFKWYTGHSDVVTWKDTPQDAASLVQWRERMHDVYGQRDPDAPVDPEKDIFSLAHRPVAALVAAGHKYKATYVLTETQPRLPLELVYWNRTYAVYKLPP